MSGTIILEFGKLRKTSTHCKQTDEFHLTVRFIVTTVISGVPRRQSHYCGIQA